MRNGAKFSSKLDVYLQRMASGKAQVYALGRACSAKFAVCSYRNGKIAENWNKLAKFLLVCAQKSYITRKGIFQLFFCKLWH